MSEQCSERVFPDRYAGGYPCQRPATIQHDGKWYCWQHNPEYVEKKRQKSREKWDVHWARKNAQAARRSAERAACAGVPTKVLLTVSVTNLIKSKDSQG